MKIFMTGATGFIGSWVARTLLESGHELVLLVRNPGKNPQLQAHPKVQIVRGDLAELSAPASPGALAPLRAALASCDACVHLALGWGETPVTMLQADTLATVRLLELCDQCGVQQFLYTSSTAAMGRMRNPMREDLACEPLDLYGATKAASEAFVRGFAGKSSMRRNIIRPGYTFGNPAFPQGVTQPDGRFRNIAQAALENRDISLIRHDGTQFASGADLARLYALALESDFTDQVWLGLGTRWVSWAEVAHIAIEICQSKSSLVFEERGWGAEPMVFDVGKARADLGWETEAEPALTAHVRWCVENAASGNQ